MEVVKITKKIYKAVGCEEGHFFGTFAHFKELRESSNLSVQKTCFCCGHKFQPEDFISLACFDKGLGNKFLCQKCKDIALKDLGDKNIYLHQCLMPSDINRQNMNTEKLERANILNKSLIPKVDELLNMSPKSNRSKLVDAIWGLSQHDRDFETKFKQLLNETKQRLQKEFDELQ